MKTKSTLVSISALAVTLLLMQPTYANEDQLTEEEAQDYARELLKPEEERAGLDRIRDEPSDRYLEEKEDNRLEGNPGELPEVVAE